MNKFELPLGKGILSKGIVEITKHGKDNSNIELSFPTTRKGLIAFKHWNKMSNHEQNCFMGNIIKLFKGGVKKTQNNDKFIFSAEVSTDKKDFSIETNIFINQDMSDKLKDYFQSIPGTNGVFIFRNHSFHANVPSVFDMNATVLLVVKGVLEVYLSSLSMSQDDILREWCSTYLYHASTISITIDQQLIFAGLSVEDLLYTYKFTTIR